MRALIVAAVCLVSAASRAADWPMFRGPHGQGVSDDVGFPTTWSAEKNVLWRVPLPGPGNGSPIVTGDRVLLASATENGHRRSLTCYARETGAELWNRTVEYPHEETTHETNPHGATTPATDGERVVVWHGSAGVYCYDLNGEPLWSTDLGTFHHIWGYASSPIIHDGRVFLLCGPGERQFLIALDLHSGDKLWQHDEPGGSASEQGKYIGSWATPLVVKVNGRDQVLCGLPTRVIACDPASGALLWYVTGVSSDRSDLMYTTPVVQEEFAVACGGFGGPSLGFALGGRGDVTEMNRKWRDPPDQPRQPQRIGSGIILGDSFFIANADDPGSIECRDLHTGQPRWTVRRTSDGPHWGSLVLAEGRLYAPGQTGVTRVFRPNPEQFEELAENDLGEQTHASPAFSDGDIFIRTWQALYCIREQR